MTDRNAESSDLREAVETMGGEVRGLPPGPVVITFPRELSAEEAKRLKDLWSQHQAAPHPAFVITDGGNIHSDEVVTAAFEAGAASRQGEVDKWKQLALWTIREHRRSHTTCSFGANAPMEDWLQAEYDAMEPEFAKYEGRA